MYFRSNLQEPLLNLASQNAIKEAIVSNENKSSGEIVIFLEPYCTLENPLERGQQVFEKLNLNTTLSRNAVLIYIAMHNRKYAIVGDVGIHEKVGGNSYWQYLANEFRFQMMRGDIKEAICYCINEIGTCLSKHFPPIKGRNINEISNEIIFGK